MRLVASTRLDSTRTGMTVAFAKTLHNRLPCRMSLRPYALSKTEQARPSLGLELLCGDRGPAFERSLDGYGSVFSGGLTRF